MFTDNYAFNQPIIFEHKEREPRWFNILCIVSILIAIPMIFWCYNRAKEQNLTCLISIPILVLFAFLFLALGQYCNRFNFYYIVTFGEDSFTIGIPDTGYVQTKRFSRQAEYQFKEKSRLVYIRDCNGNRTGFRYDENFRKFLEEIQIN